MRREDFIYFEEHTSPDGVWRVEYGYSDGEKGPTIIEPRVIENATGRVFVDFWRRYVIGHVGDFTPDGFQLRLTEPLTSKTMHASINTRNETFTIVGEAVAPRPLNTLYQTWADFFVRARNEREAESAGSEPPPATSFWERLRQRIFP